MVHFGEFLKTWILLSNSVTRQVSFNWTKIGGKCQNTKIQMRHFRWFSNTVGWLEFLDSALLCIDGNICSSLRSFWSESPQARGFGCAKKTGSKSYRRVQQQGKTALREYFFTIQKLLFIMKGIHYYTTWVRHRSERECQFL